MDNRYLDLQEKFGRLMWLMHRKRMQHMAEHGPFADSSRGQGRVLAILKMQDEISTRELSYLLGIHRQSLNELLSKLEKGGYVTRTASKEDGRVMLVSLTEKGREEKLPEPDRGAIFDCLDEKEQAELCGHLDKLIKALEDKLGPTLDEEGGHGCMHGPHPKAWAGKFGRMRHFHGGCDCRE